MATTFPTPPVDGSGGYLEIIASDGIDSHRIRVHVPPFTIVGTTTSPFNYAYSPSGVAGAETGVNDTAQAFMNAIKVGYDVSWDFAVANLVQNVGGVLTPVFPVPAAAASGSNGLVAVHSYDVARATVSRITMHTTATTGRTRYVLNLPCFGRHNDELNSNAVTTGALPQLVGLVEANSGGTELEKVVYYITEGAAANGVRAHDGFKPVGIAKVSIAENARLKRRYGFS